MSLFTEVYPSASAPLLYLCVFLSLRCFSYLRFVFFKLRNKPVTATSSRTVIPPPAPRAQWSNDTSASCHYRSSVQWKCAASRSDWVNTHTRWNKGIVAFYLHFWEAENSSLFSARIVFGQLCHWTSKLKFLKYSNIMTFSAFLQHVTPFYPNLQEPHWGQLSLRDNKYVKTFSPVLIREWRSG